MGRARSGRWPPRALPGDSCFLLSAFPISAFQHAREKPLNSLQAALRNSS